MKYDINQARSEYNFDTGLHRAGNFTKFSPAYLTTNEDVREILSLLRPEPGMRILTVAGSGDQALQYKLSGASHIDTFDITFNAKMMMDIKTVGIQQCDFRDYKRLLRSVDGAENVCDVPEYKSVAKYMPNDTRAYIEQMRGAKLIRGGVYYEENTQNEFEKLKQTLDKPFNFIWTDLSNLASHLTQTYDQIYLSNIIQYHPSHEYIIPVINSLVPHLNPNGKIMVSVSTMFTYEDFAALEYLKHYVERNKIGVINILHNHLFDICILQKR